MFSPFLVGAQAAMAVARNGVNVDVRSNVGVPLPAEGDLLRAANVLGMSDQFQVLRPDAVANLTFVIPFQSFGCLANEILMRAEQDFLGPEAAVARRCTTAEPQGATVCSAGIDVTPEASFLGSTSARRRQEQASDSIFEHRYLLSAGVTGTEGATSRPHHFTIREGV